MKATKEDEIVLVEIWLLILTILFVISLGCILATFL